MTDSNVHETPSVTSSGDDLDQVTRQQEGQFIDEGPDLIRFGDPLDDIHDAAPDAQLIDGGAERINALQVTMDRSGAEFIHAQKAFLTNSGAKTITGESSKLIQSGVLTLNTDTAEFHQSSSVITRAKSMTVDGGSIVYASAGEMQLSGNAKPGVVQAASVKADGDVRAFMIVSGNVQAGGNVSNGLSAGSAATFGAVFGVVVFLLSRLFGRGNR